nr:PREDICTED: galectin-4 [Lepisosteus oculatus]
MTFVAPPGYQPLYNPTVPYLGPINGNLRAGMSIYIQGRVPHEITSCSRLSVPQVNVNGRQFYLFQHRMPLERVSNLEIGGDVIIQSLNILGVREGGRKRGATTTTTITSCLCHYCCCKNSCYCYCCCCIDYCYCCCYNNYCLYCCCYNDYCPCYCCWMQGYPGGMGGGMQGGMQGYQGGMQDYPCGGMGGMGGGMQGYPSGGMGGMGGGMQGYPGGGMGYPGANLPMISGAPVYNPPIPYSNMIPGGMTPKRTIIIRGMVPYGANRFHMNFMVGFSRDIAFHLNPRVAEGLVVRNSCLGGSWGQEESDLEFNPFQEGQYFEISVRCGNQRYKVFVNGQYLCDFFHRLQPFTQVDTLEVEGDVQLSYIHF